MSDQNKPGGCAHAQAHGTHKNAMIVGEGTANDREQGFRFGRIVPNGNFQPMILKGTAATRIGDEMVKATETGDSPIPAGYTYFGQFVDHDITRDTFEAENESDDPNTDPIEATPDSAFETAQGRSPALDLDSLYGAPHRRDDSLFRAGGASFKIGRTVSSPGAGHSGKAHPLDLPRGPDRGVRGGLIAAIPDQRNDENLIVGQTHLMWMLFHNNVVGAIESDDPSKDPATVFAEARALVTKHYQYVVLHDFVRRLITKEVYDEVIVGGKRTLLQQGTGEVAFMPLEFSVAAYRLGHSMVRESYEWNLNFSTGGAIIPQPSGFRLMFQFSGLSGTLTPPGSPPGDALPSNWIADYRRLYELKGYKPNHLQGATPVSGPNFARKIDPYLAPDLASLPADANGNLAFLNLRRGSLRGLPSGQDVSRFMSNVKVLSRTEMKRVLKGDPSFDQAMEASGFYDRTPLWLYVLIEAAARQKGDRMGEMGSRILAETFLTLVLTSRISILHPLKKWTPKDAVGILKPKAPLETMPDILKWIDGAEPIVNPLEDKRA